MSLSADVITPGGDILAHGRAGLSIALTFQDEAGADADASALDLFFEIDGVARVALEAGDVDSERILALTQEQIAAIPETGADFVLLDETSTPSARLWAGRIRRQGFTEQPA